MKLNSLNLSDLTTKKRKRICRGIGSVKEKLVVEALKVRNLEQEFQLMALKVVKCHCT